MTPKAKITPRSIFDDTKGLFKYKGAFLSPYMKELEMYQRQYLLDNERLTEVKKLKSGYGTTPYLFK
jgi:hypothetical protein